MSYYKTCPNCGAHLDPGEHCECQENTTPSAANTEGGKVEHVDHAVSASDYT